MKFRLKYGYFQGKLNRWLLLIMIFLFSEAGLLCQETRPKASRQSAVSAFNKGDYENAYRQFDELLTIFPKDPVYRYYSGVCLIKMQKDPEKAAELLSQARRDGALLRTVPSDALFWLGRAQHLSGRFNEAISAYNEFTDLAGRKAAKELDIPGFIQQCREGRGRLTVIPSVPAKEEIITGRQELSPDRDVAVTSSIPEAKKEIPVYRPPDSAVFTNEDTLAGKPDDHTGADTLQEAVIPVADQDTIRASKSEALPPEEEVEDTTFQVLIDEHITAAVKETATAGVLMLFFIDPKLVHDQKDKIRINPKHPQGLIYRIQTAVFRNPAALSYFKGISPVYGIKNYSSGLTTYYAGMFRKIEDAKNALPQVRQKGFKDAFIVAFSGGKPVSLQRAEILEKEWGMIPFMPEEAVFREIATDTIPPTLSFRVEVVRTLKPVSEQNYEELKRLSGTRGLDIQTAEDGSIVYLIGQFITYESAENYADLLVRNGYRDAKVVAWLGKKEIPVETARQLFESLR